MREIFGTICLAGAIQAVLLSLALLARKNNRRANRFLALYLVFLALDGLELYLGARGFISPPRPYQLSIIPYSFLFGPTMYLYIALLTARINSLTRKHFLFYVPFLAVFMVNLILYFVFDGTRLPLWTMYVNMAINGGGLLFEAILYLLSLFMIQRYIERLKEYFSAIDALKLSLFRIILVVVFIVVIIFFVSLMWNGQVSRDYKAADTIAILVSLALGFAFIVTAMIQPEIFNRVRLMEKAVPHDETLSSPRYEKLRLSREKEKEYVEKLQQYMSREKPYLREELTLQDMADDMSLSTQHLSMILNIHFRQNFYTFINSYRVEDVKRKLLHPDYRDHTILSIAYSSGFNSKSTFNTMFRKFTGKTPKEYRTQIPPIIG